MKTPKQTYFKKGLAVLVSSLLLFGLAMPMGVQAEEAPPANIGTIVEITPLAEEVTAQAVPEGTVLEALALPETLPATVETPGAESGPPETAPQELAVSWQSNPAYDGGTAGSYVFTPTLPEGYTLLEGLSLPQITVTVGTGEELPAGETEETPSETVPIAPFSLSNDASLLKVAGLTITPGSESGTSGAPITAAVTVPNITTTIAETDLIAAAGATAQLFDDSGFSNETTVTLADGNNNHLYVKVTAEDGVTVLYYHITVTRVDSAMPYITTQGGSLGVGMAGVAYYSDTIGSSQSFSLTWTATPSLPDGLSFGPGGNYTNIQGTPSTAGDYTFQLTVTKDGNTSAPVEFSIKVLEASYVWFGEKQWFVVGDESSGVQAPTGALTLLSKDGYGTAQFHGSSREYSGSNLRIQMDAEASALSTGEQASITARNLDGGGGNSDGDRIAGVGVDDALFWPMSINEAYTLPIYGRVFSTTWWLRSPGSSTDTAAVVGFDGAVHPAGDYVFFTCAIRPALYLNLSSVLFTSDAGGVKPDTVGPNLSAVTPPTGAVKLTVKDVYSGTTNTTGQRTPSISQIRVSGRTITFNYNGATANTTLSAIVTGSDGTVKYYGQLVAASSNTAGNDITVTVPDGFAATDKLEIFTEKLNATYQTDYCSEPVTLVSSANAAPAAPTGLGTTAPSTSGGNGSITGTTAAMEYSTNGTTWNACTSTSTSVAPGTYQVRVKATMASGAFTPAGTAASVTVNGYSAPTYTLSVTAPTFASVTYGTQPAAQDLTITSTGNTNATISSVALSGTNASSFTLGGTQSTTVIAGGTNTTWTVRPNANLSAGTHTATVTVTYDGGATATATVSIIITKASQTAPAAPTLSSKTAESITLNTISGAEYSKNNGANWQDSPIFSGLMPSTSYTFVARLKETANLAASPSSSSSAAITTDEQTQAVAARNSITLPSGSITAGVSFTFTAAGDRQSATGTINGETRYIPVSWSVNPSGTFPAGSPYTATAKIDNAGSYTLTVTYQLQSWNGSVWENVTGSTDSKTAAITVAAGNSGGGGTTPPTPASTTPTSPQTGDSSNLGLWLALMSLAMLGGGVAVWQLVRTRKKNEAK